MTILLRLEMDQFLYLTALNQWKHNQPSLYVSNKGAQLTKLKTFNSFKDLNLNDLTS